MPLKVEPSFHTSLKVSSRPSRPLDAGKHARESEAESIYDSWPNEEITEDHPLAWLYAYRADLDARFGDDLKARFAYYMEEQEKMKAAGYEFVTPTSKRLEPELLPDVPLIVEAQSD